MRSEIDTRENGNASLVLLSAQVIGIALLAIAVVSSDLGESISATSILGVITIVSTSVMSPIGFFLGLAGALRVNRKSMVGLVGNLVLGLLVLALVISDAVISR